ncbi:MAG TPA: HypC/HybG/HupF family hydrogenase formation chaperone [Spirochaetia bacterium]|nr:HypC/HybG/HupF family hydrogenase formation chaperone [Spirochaetia bacterium]
MCLAIPMKITEISGNEGTVEAGGMRYPASLSLVPEARVGDYVIVHAGYAIQKLDAADAEETLALFREMDRAAADETPPITENPET